MDLPGQLQSALVSTYRLERELGGGGMSRVFVATERALDRPVVLKVLPPELAQAVSTERFRQEIRLAARLQHPHIVALLAAGEADGLLYYTMPFIEGESLRVRLAREGELPVRDAVRVLRDLAAALAYAHEHGVVHRDIKPDNVLLSGGEALVTDFGVAKALSASATDSGSGLTSLGVALGTPAYMAPEQAAADPHVDHRADLYAFGCVAYEVLTGQPPFSGRSAATLLAAHAKDDPEPVERRRPVLPGALALLVMRCLEKRPADRPQSAGEVLQALEAIATPSGGVTPTVPLPARPRPRAGRLAVLLGGMFLLLAGGAALLWHRSARAAAGPLDPQRVAVLPFRVTGADPSLAYLREGMVDLLAAKLTGEGGPRAADPRAAVGAWRAEAGGRDDIDEAAGRRAASRIGAGQVLLGSVVGSPRHVVLSAQLLPSTGSGPGSQATVEGLGDSLPILLDQLVGRLLALRAGEGDQRLASLTTPSLPALRAYLDGRSEYRQGRYAEAVAHLESAVQLDSTFALAAFGLIQAGVWIDYADQPRAEDLAWRLRGRLSARDRLLLEAFIGSRGPRASSGADLLAARVRAVEAVPDQADAWYYLGDHYFHYGRLLGLEDAHERAAAAFRRALALDSSFAGPLGHQVILMAERGDTAELRRRGEQYFRVTATDTAALYTRWRVAQGLRDPAMLAQVRALIDSSPDPSGVALFAWDEGLDLADADRAVEAIRRNAATPGARGTADYAKAVLEFNRGRPHAGRAALSSTEGDPALDIGQALLVDGDSAIAAATAQRMAPLLLAAPAATAEGREVEYRRLFWLEAWRLSHGDTLTTERTIQRLRAAGAPRDSSQTVEATTIRAALLSAWLVIASGSDPTPQLLAADSLLRRTPEYLMNTIDIWENLVLARLFATSGDNRRGLAAVRRRAFTLSDQGSFLATCLREEGRLAALTGDRAGAIRAYSRYLAMRSDPEPELRPQVAEVKAELARLVGEPESR